MTESLWNMTNRANWDDRARVHLAGGRDYYDLTAVREGSSSLRSLERDLAGDVSGCRILHAMCHIGIDSISWARLGASVTAVDFSSASIVAARKLAADCDVSIEFHEADIYHLPDACDGPFDVAIMTYGVLCWLRDFRKAANLIAERLERGGRFVLVDGHPVTNLWTNQSPKNEFRPREDHYFSAFFPEACDQPHSYGGDATLNHVKSYQWRHHTAEIIQAIIDSGLRLKTIRVETYGFYRRFPGMTLRPDGYLDPPIGLRGVPMLLGLMAEKP
jgi:SAM-dependent methyltransferase